MSIIFTKTKIKNDNVQDMYKILLQMNQPTKKKLHHENVNLIYAKHYNSMTRYIMKKKIPQMYQLTKGIIYY